MRVIVKEELEIYEPSDNVIDYCEKKLVIDNPDYINALKVGRYTGNMEKKLHLYRREGNVFILPFGCLKDIFLNNKDAVYEIKISDFKRNNLKGNINLYDYQKNALNALKSAKNGILEAPCGSGKTNIALQLIKEIGGRALWLTHTKHLLQQSLERAKVYFEGKFGTITEGKFEIGEDITFATVQTLSKIKASLYKNSFDMVIVDECHHCVGSPTKMTQFYNVLSSCNCRYKYGLSATLDRSDNLIESMYAVLGPKIYTIDKSDVNDKIIKAKHIKYDIDLNYDEYSYIESDGMINYTLLINELCYNKERSSIIADNIIELKDQREKQLVLCHRVEQAKYIYDLIKNKIDSVLIVGNTKKKNVSFDHKVIVSTYQLAKEGLDIVDLDTLHLASPSKNKSIIIQSAGRIERNIKNKKQPLIYDYVDVNVNYCLSCYKKRKKYLK